MARASRNVRRLPAPLRVAGATPAALTLAAQAVSALAGAIAAPAKLTASAQTAAQATATVGTPTATRAATFPVSLTSTNTGTVNPQKIGDLMIVAGRRGSNVSDVTAITGGGCTNWHKVTDVADAADFIYGFLWAGTVSTIGSQTITLTVTDSASSEITVDSFTSPVAGTWMTDVSNSGTGTGTVPTMPSLTPTKAGSTPIPELYYGWLFTNGSYTAGGTTPGYHYENIPFADGPLAYSTNVVSGAQQPAITVGSGSWVGMAGIFYIGTSVPVALTPSAQATGQTALAVTAPASLAATAQDQTLATVALRASTLLTASAAATSAAVSALQAPARLTASATTTASASTVVTAVGIQQLTATAQAAASAVSALIVAAVLTPAGQAASQAFATIIIRVVALNTAEGGTAAATVTTANSGGTSGRAWDQVDIASGASVIFDTTHAHTGQ